MTAEMGKMALRVECLQKRRWEGAGRVESWPQGMKSANMGNLPPLEVGLSVSDQPYTLEMVAERSGVKDQFECHPGLREILSPKKKGRRNFGYFFVLWIRSRTRQTLPLNRKPDHASWLVIQS